MSSNDSFFGSWTWEFAAMIGSSWCLVAQMIVLAVCEGKPVFDWHGITLNALVSALSTASKASLLFAVEELVSQWKWILFTDHARPLMDFERVDAASRGPLGSLQLLWKSKQVSILRIGSLIILLAAAIDPFSQQLVQYKQKIVNIEDVDTTLTRAFRYSKGYRTYSAITEGETLDSNNFTWFASAFASADPSMQSAVLFGLDQPLEKVTQQRTFSCSTGNCTWPTYESLAICNRCINVDSKLERIPPNTSVQTNAWSIQIGDVGFGQESNTCLQLPNGLFMENNDGMLSNGSSDLEPTATGQEYADDQAVLMTTFGTGNASQTVSTQDLDTLIWSMSIIRIKQDQRGPGAVWPDLPLSVMECALYYCVNSYETVVENGVLQESATQVQGAQRSLHSWQLLDPEITYILGTEGSSSIEFDGNASAWPRTDLAILSPNSNIHYNISQTSVNSISSYFQDTFAGDLQVYNITENGSIQGKLNGFYTRDNLRYEPPMLQALSSTEDFNQIFNTLATSMSNVLRDGADDMTGGVVTGKKGVLNTTYEIQWPWITLHCVMLILGAAFFGLTLSQNRSVPVWKSSSLAVMTRGHLQVVQGVVQGTQNVKQMEQRAKGVQVVLLAPLKVDQMEYDPLESL